VPPLFSYSPVKSKPEAGKLNTENLQELHGPVAVLHAGRCDHYRQEQAKGVDQNVAFAAVVVFVRIVARDPPFSVVSTD